MHYPIQCWNDAYIGIPHLCGHTHGDNVRSRPENTDERIIDVGWDVFKQPISLTEVDTIIQKTETSNTHHAKEKNENII